MSKHSVSVVRIKKPFRRKKLLEGALSGSRASALTDWGERKNEREGRAKTKLQTTNTTNPERTAPEPEIPAERCSFAITVTISHEFLSGILKGSNLSNNNISSSLTVLRVYT